MADAPERCLENALFAARLFAVDPAGLGGIALRAPAGPVRDAWLGCLRAALPEAAPFVPVPLHVGADRLLGGLDLTASLAAGRAVAERGLLVAADGGVLLLAMAERLAGSTTSSVTAAMDRQAILVERDGLTLRHAARFGVVALDEGIEAEETLPAALMDRLAFRLDLATVPPRHAEAVAAAWLAEGLGDIPAASARLASVTIGEAVPEALAAAALSLGVDSLRAVLLALRVARTVAALEGRAVAGEAEATLAAALVLAPRATQLPLPPSEAAPDEAAENGGHTEAPLPDSPDPEGQTEAPDSADQAEGETTPPPAASPADKGGDEEGSAMPDLDELVLAAAVAAIPAGLLDRLKLQGGARGAARAPGKAGQLQQAKRRGRPLGSRRGLPRGGQRLALVDTLRAAAPWQKLRRAERTAEAPARRVEVRPDDLRISRFKQRTETTVIFVVDASGSTAFNRLAEAKGAVELLLADCYVRRESVALIAFRGAGADLLLSPTRSLTRAKRALAGLPGGGGTPLAAGLDAALELALAVRRKGQTPILVLLADGRANIARDGRTGRPAAEADAWEVARDLRAAGLTTLFVDTSPRPQAKAQELATTMAARYLALPRADAATLSAAVKSNTAGLRAAG